MVHVIFTQFAMRLSMEVVSVETGWGVEDKVMTAIFYFFKKYPARKEDLSILSTTDGYLWGLYVFV